MNGPWHVFTVKRDSILFVTNFMHFLQSGVSCQKPPSQIEMFGVSFVSLTGMQLTIKI